MKREADAFATCRALTKGVAFASGDTVIFSGPRGGRGVGWRLSSGTPFTTLSHHTGQVYQVATSPDESLLVSAGEDGTAGIWELKDGRLRATLPHANRVRSVAFSPDGALVGTASEDHTAAIWRASDGARSRHCVGTVNRCTRWRSRLTAS